jgi:hypothetical protein
MFNRVYGFYFEREINHVLAEQDTLSIGPGIGSSARYIRGLPWLDKLCLHGQQEIAIDGQRVRDRTDQEGLNVTVWRRARLAGVSACSVLEVRPDQPISS